MHLQIVEATEKDYPSLGIVSLINQFNQLVT